MRKKDVSNRCFVYSLVCSPQPHNNPSDRLQTGGDCTPCNCMNKDPYKTVLK